MRRLCRSLRRALVDIHGRVLYKASGENIPQTAGALFEEMNRIASIGIARPAPSAPWPENNLRAIADTVNATLVRSQFEPQYDDPGI